jgi:hypothetical protein
VDTGTAFYAALAREPGRARVVEVPALFDQGIALYRNYARQHHKDVAIGFLGSPLRRHLGWPHLAPFNKEAVGGDYLVLHLDVAGELDRYWRFVYEHEWPKDGSSARRAFMDFHRHGYVSPPPRLDAAAADLEARFGKPIYRDDDILVWKAGH